MGFSKADTDFFRIFISLCRYALPIFLTNIFCHFLNEFHVYNPVCDAFGQSLTYS